MKCYFTLALALLAATTGSAYAENNASAKWALGTAVFKDIPAEVTPEGVFSATNVNYTGSIGTEKKRTAKPESGEIPMTGYNAVMAATVDKDSYVEFSMELAKPVTVNNVAWDWASIKHTSGMVDVELLIDGTAVSITNSQKPARTNEDATYDAAMNYHFAKAVEVATASQTISLRFYMYGDATKARTFGLANVTVSGTVSEDTPVDPGFGEGALAVSNVWPANNNAMLPLNGEFVLTFPADVTVAGKADLNGTALDMTAETTTVKIPYTNLAAATEYTLTIPAKTIGNSEGANEAITYTFTTRPANVLFYSDFKQYPYAYYEQFGNISATTELFGSTSATDVTKDYEGMIFYSGTKGRCAIMTGASNGATTDVDYGPETEADFGASDYCAQMIGGSGSYIQFPEVEGPVELTFFIANPDAKNAPVVKLTDQDGDLENPLASFAFNKTKRMRKFTYSYPYKGKVSFRIYNMGKKIDVNDVLIVKGEGEGIDKPADTEAPVLVKSWPSTIAYAPTSGTIELQYNEAIVITGKATVNGVETDVVVDGKKATIAYSGLENGKSYTIAIPAVADEAGNELPASEMTINTAAAEVLYYTDFNVFPYAYWEKYNQYPNASAENEDIFAKNTANKEAQIAGIKYVVGATAGRVVAMGKSNLLDDPDGVNASDRCLQISGGGNDLYLELPEALGPCKLTLIIGNSTAKAFEFTLRNAADSENAIATFNVTADKKMFKFEHTVELENNPVRFRIYNNGNQFNLHDILITKVEKGGTVGIEAVAAEADAPAVYYNLQGARVENPAEGLYIRVKGNKVEKVIL